MFMSLSVMQHLHVAHWIKDYGFGGYSDQATVRTLNCHISCFYPPILLSSFRWTYIPTMWYNDVQEVIPADCDFLFVPVIVLERF